MTDSQSLRAHHAGSGDRKRQLLAAARKRFLADGFVNTATGQIIVSYQNRLTNDGVIIPENKIHPLGASGVLGKRQFDLRRAKAKAEKEAAKG